MPISRQIYAFFFRARCALKPVDFKKIRLRTSVFLAFGFLSSPLRGAKPCFLPLFSIMAKTLQQAKSSKKMLFIWTAGPPAPTWPKNMTKMYRKNFARVSPFILPSKVPFFRQSPPPPLPPWSSEEITSKIRNKRTSQIISIPNAIYIYI